MTFTILSLTGAYTFVAALLAYLVILSRTHWVFKTLSTLATAVLIPLTFYGVGELRGLPSDGPVPQSFRMLWAQVDEPNPLTGDKGHVFLWLQRLDAKNYPVGQPRAYQLPYSRDLQVKVKQAQVKIAQGSKIQGQIKKTLPKNTSTANSLAQDVKLGQVTEGRGGGGGNVGERVFQFKPSMLTFAPEAAPITPGKPP